MFGLKWINWFRHRHHGRDAGRAHALDPLVSRALVLLGADPQATHAPEALASRLLTEEASRHAWQDGGHWAEHVCREAAATALRLHTVALHGDE